MALTFGEIERMTPEERRNAVTSIHDFIRGTYILAAAISSVSAGTYFGGGNGEHLDSRLQKLFYENRNRQIIRDYFNFDQDGFSSEIYEQFHSPFFPLGQQLGLENFGADFQDKVTEKLAQVAREGRARFLSDDDFRFLQDIGKKLI